jgi:RNA polymerase II-associated factor 1
MRVVSRTSPLLVAFTDQPYAAIQAPLQLPVPHPHDRALLRPLSTLGKPKFSDTGVSFLRRTEYISSYTSKSRFESTTSRSLIDNTGSKKKRPMPNFDKESPESIKKQVEESFNIAARNIKNKHLARHPTKKNVHVVDAYPLLPDLDAFPEAGGYVTVKFLTNPVPPSTTYDVRVENSMLVPIDIPEEERAAREAAQDAHMADPERNPPPDNTLEYELFLTETVEAAQNFKRKFDILDNDHQEEELYTEKQGNGEGCFRFKRIRAYESATCIGTAEDKYDEEVFIALHDGKDGRLQKGAYYYPVVQRVSIRPQRQKNIDKRMGRMQSQQEEVTDYMDMRIDDPGAEVVKIRNQFRDYPFGKPEEEVTQGDAGTPVEE